MINRIPNIQKNPRHEADPIFSFPYRGSFYVCCNIITVLLQNLLFRHQLPVSCRRIRVSRRCIGIRCRRIRIRRCHCACCRTSLLINTWQIDTSRVNGTGRCLQIGTDAICGIQCDCLCHSTLHRWKQYFGLYNLIRAHGRCQQSGICTDIRKYVFIAGLCGLCAIRKIFIDDDAGSSIAVTYTWNCQLAGLSTNRYLYNARRFVEIFIFQILMNPAHDFGPQLLMETCLSCLTAQFSL